MKTSRIILCSIAFVCAQVAAEAQTTTNNLAVGITAGVNLSNVYGSDVTDNAMKIGFHGGVLVNLPLNPNFSIVPGALYSLKGTQSDINSDYKINLSYLEIPVVVNYKLDNGLGFFIGPYLGILLAATAEPGGVDVKDQAETIDFGGKAGISYMLPMGLSFNAHYELGFTDIMKAPSGGTAPSEKNNNIGVGVAYWFGSK
jgi:hypothetical protein